ncbi:hypothetical protein ACP70R_043177 [Stipagrostis hirtigluma subsp. patula]
MAIYSPPPPSTSTENSSKYPGEIIAGVSIAVGTFLLVLTFTCSLCKGYRDSRATADAAAAAAALTLRPPRSPEPEPRRDAQDDAAPDGGRSRRVRPTAGLPSFTYNRSLKHNVTGAGGEEAAATCSVCLGAFQRGETVRLLPVCLHLYHVECIDPWLDAHSTCPLCRSATDPTMDGGQLPPV